MESQREMWEPFDEALRSLDQIDKEIAFWQEALEVHVAKLERLKAWKEKGCPACFEFDPETIEETFEEMIETADDIQKRLEDLQAQREMADEQFKTKMKQHERKTQRTEIETSKKRRKTDEEKTVKWEDQAKSLKPDDIRLHFKELLDKAKKYEQLKEDVEMREMLQELLRLYE